MKGFSNSFIHAGDGKNSWKRYLFSFVLLLAVIFAGSIAGVIMEIWYAGHDHSDSSYFDIKKGEAVNISPISDFVIWMAVYMIWMLGLAIIMKLVHKRSIWTLASPKGKLDLKRTLWGFGLFFTLMGAASILDFLIHPHDFTLNTASWNVFWKFFILALFLVPIQTTTEELIFRGYLMQLFGKFIKSPLLLAIAAGLLFASLHFSNPEMKYSKLFVGADYVLTGIIWSWITVKTNSAELTIGAHAANNLFIIWFLTTETNVFGSIPSLFVQKRDNPELSLFWSFVTLAVFAFLSIRKYGGNHTIQTPAEPPTHYFHQGP